MKNLDEKSSGQDFIWIYSTVTYASYRLSTSRDQIIVTVCVEE